MNAATSAACRNSRQEWIERFDAGGRQAISAEALGHAQVCPRCRRELTELGALRRRLAALPLPDPGEDFRRGFLADVRRRLEGGRPPGRVRRDRAWAPALAAAAITLLLILRAPVQIGSPDSSTEIWRLSLNSDQGAAESEASAAWLENLSDALLDSSEAEIVTALSQSTLDPAADLLDRLTDLDDAALLEVLERLQSEPVIRPGADS